MRVTLFRVFGLSLLRALVVSLVVLGLLGVLGFPLFRGMFLSVRFTPMFGVRSVLRALMAVLRGLLVLFLASLGRLVPRSMLLAGVLVGARSLV